MSNFKPKRVRLPWEPTPSHGKTNRHSFYGTSQWQKLRAIQLRKCPLCAVCDDAATIVDHIKPVNQDDPYTYDGVNTGSPTDMENMQSLCVKCHAVKTAREKKYKKYQ